jgi:hypothetical protein
VLWCDIEYPLGRSNWKTHAFGGDHAGRAAELILEDILFQWNTGTCMLSNTYGTYWAIYVPQLASCVRGMFGMYSVTIHIVPSVLVTAVE